MQTQVSDNQVAQPKEIDEPVGSFPLTFAQQRLWFLEQLNPGQTSYLVPLCLRIRGPLDVAALEQSLNEVVRRHEILRTTYSTRDGEPVQLVAAPSYLPLIQISLEHLQDREAEARRRIAVEAARPIDLAAGPMVRTSLLRLSEEEHLLLLTMHHISFDGWSRAIWIREISQLYADYRDGKEARLPDLPIQYGDYAVWQRERCEGERLADDLAYWKEQLADAPATLDLPTDRPRPAMQTYSGASYRVEWPESLSSGLKALGQREGATLFMVLLCGFQVLLGRYSGQDDVVVGTPLANRSRPELERLIGYFANTIVLRTRLDGNPSFRELLAQVRETALGAYAHAELPFERLVEELEPVRSTSYNPIFQVLFSLRNAPEEELALPGLKLEFVGAPTENAKFDLSFFFAERQGGLVCRVEYNTDLYLESTIAGLVGYYRGLLESVVLDGGCRLGELGLVGEEEERELLGSWRGAEVAYRRAGSVYGLFEEQAERCAERVAVVFGEQQLSYGELNGRANQLAHLLLGQGVGRGHRVGLYVERSLEMMVGLLGIQKCGAAYVPLDPGYPEERIRQTLAEAGTSVVVVGGGLEGRLGSAYEGRVLSLAEAQERLRQQSRSNPNTGAGGEDAAYVIFTSGSTGRPKGVEVAHRGVVNLLGWMGKELSMGESDVFPALASFAFDMSVPELYLSLVTGGRVVLGERHLAGNGEELAEFLRGHGATVVHATPTTWSLLLDAGYSGAGLKRVIGAEPLPQALFERLLEADGSLYNFYGPTETTVWSTWHHFRSKAEPVVIGRAIANTELYILDRYGHVCPAGVRGELYIGGAGVALGYLHRPELTAERFVANRFSGKGTLYRTGDLVRALADGRMEFAGRLDHQVKVRGYRIELGEIESVVGGHAAVAQCVVLARQDQPGVPRLVAYVTPRPGHSLSIPALRQLAKDKLPDYMIPSAWVQLPQLPRTPAGKIDRKNLPIPDGRERALEGGRAPFTPTQIRIAQIWEEVLNVSPIRLEDNFFNLGGHSLLAVTLIERMRRNGFAVTVRALFAAPTLAELAATVGADTEAIDVPPNRIPPGCEALTPEMLPLIELTAKEIDKAVSAVPGGAANVQDIYPLAPLQEGFLFHHLMGGEGDPYLLRLQFGFDSRARLDSYIDALQAVVDRHDILRTAVAWEGLPEPVQVVWRKASLHVEEVELDRDVSEQLYARFDPRRFRIDVRRAPLLRLYIAYDKEKNRWLLMQLLHHLAGDHTTLEVMRSEVQAHLLGQQAMLPAPLPFRNLVAQARLGVSQQEHEAFFRQMLGDVDEPTAPFGLLDVQGDGSGLEDARLVLDSDLAHRLRAHARRLGVSAASLCHLAWARVLARLSGREDVVFGTVLFGRMRGGEGADRVMGLFINTLPIRISVGEQGVEASVRRTHALLADLMHHEHASLALAQRCSAVPAPAPLFSALFNYRHILGAAQAASPDAQQAWQGFQRLRGEELTNYPISLSVNDLGEGFSLDAQTPASVVPLRVCEFMRTALTSLVEALETSPATAVRTLEVLPSAERHRVLREWNETAAVYPSNKCVHELFEEQAARTPDAVAVVFEEASLSYAELNGRANQLAHYLRGLGVRPDARVAICLERGLEMIVALLAVLKAGGAYVPLDPAYPLERLRFMLEDAAPVTLLTQAHLHEMFTEIGDRVPVLDLSDGEAPWSKLRSDNTDPHAIGLEPSHLAYVTYTSGSTGQPRGVMVAHQGVVNELTWTQRTYGLDSGDAVLQKTSFNFDTSISELFWPLITGSRLVMVRPGGHKDPAYLVETIERRDISVALFVPSELPVFLQYATGAKSSTLKHVICGGEALSAALVRRFQKQLPNVALHNSYGPTETTIDATVWPCPAGQDLTTVPIGRPIANTRIYILDAHGEPVPVGVAGELYISGAGVARGYLNRPELTAEKFLADPFSSDPRARMYRTGDLGRHLPDGNIEFLGRNDFQVKLRGFRIELGEIETRLAEHAGVREAVVIAREDTPGDQRLVAYYTSVVEEAAPGAEVLRTHLAAALPEYMVPAAYVRLEALPLTPNGKLDRKALPAPEAGAYSSRGYEAPQGETEIQLARIWAEVLRLDRVGRHDDFFNLGGHSLLAVKMVAKVSEYFGDALPLATLFQTSTLAGLARVLELERGRVPLPTIIPIRASGAKPALFCVSRPNVNALGFIFLARHLAQDRPVFGLQTQMKEDGKSWTYNQQDYETKAAEYISAMREVQPNGPYLLAGFCEGAHIAFEMARQLEACNLPVAMIAILDAWPIENTVSRARFKLRSYWRGMQRWASTDREVRARLVKAKLRSMFPSRLDDGSFEEDTGVAGVEFRAMRAEQMKKRYWPGPDFTPPTYGGRLTLFRTQKQDFCRIRDYQMGWGARSLGGVDVIPISGAHALILREPYVADLAKKMDACIERALNVQETSPSSSDTCPAVPATA